MIFFFLATDQPALATHSSLILTTVPFTNRMSNKRIWGSNHHHRNMPELRYKRQTHRWSRKYACNLIIFVTFSKRRFISFDSFPFCLLAGRAEDVSFFFTLFSYSLTLCLCVLFFSFHFAQYVNVFFFFSRFSDSHLLLLYHPLGLLHRI